MNGEHAIPQQMTGDLVVSRTDHDLLLEAVVNIRTLLDRTVDQESRIRALERRIATLSAVATLAGGALGTTVSHLLGSH